MKENVKKKLKTEKQEVFTKIKKTFDTYNPGSRTKRATKKLEKKVS